MNLEEMKAAKVLSLKANPYFDETQIPRLYQKKMVLVMIQTPRMVNGDDVGLGKTLEAIIAYTYIKAARPETKLLIQTEKIALGQWLDTIRWLTFDIKAGIVTAETHPDPAQRVRALRESGLDVVITTYSLNYNYRQHLLEAMKPRWIYLPDEPNYFKNTESELHKKTFGMLYGDEELPANEIATNVRSYGLTATVVENRLEEAFAIFRICAPGTFPTKPQFEHDYCVMGKTKSGRRVVRRYKNLDKFRKQIAPVFYGRLQDDPEVEQELPEVIPRDLPVMMTEEQSRKVLEATDKLIKMPDGEVKQVDLLPAMILAQQLVNDPRVLGFEFPGTKTPAIIDMLENSLLGQPVVIYSKLRRCIDQIEVDLGAKGFKTCRITGNENDKQRLQSKEDFIALRAQVMLMTRAGQKALDGMQEVCNHMFIYDMPWSYGWYRQLVGRLKRTGSNFKKVGVYRLLATMHPRVANLLANEETIDHHTLRTVLKKYELFKAVTGDIVEMDTSQSDLQDILEDVKASFRLKEAA